MIAPWVGTVVYDPEERSIFGRRRISHPMARAYFD
jgi:hypothetical protein